jgi:hypothetical protein
VLGLEQLVLAVTGDLNQLEPRNNQDAVESEHGRVVVMFVVDFSLLLSGP